MKKIAFKIAIALSGISLLNYLNITQLRAMEPTKVQTLIEQAADAWIEGDGDAFAALFVTDGELIVPGKRWVGKAQIRQAVTKFAQTAANVKIDIRRIIVDGDQAVVEWHWENTEKATGDRIQADDAIIIDFKQNRIKRWREYFDTQTPKLPHDF